MSGVRSAAGPKILQFFVVSSFVFFGGFQACTFFADKKQRKATERVLLLVGEVVGDVRLVCEVAELCARLRASELY